MSKGFTPILILLVIITFSVFGYSGYKNYKQWLKDKNTPITVYTPKPTDVPVGFHGYSNSGKRFTLDFPKNCVKSSSKIECTTEKFKIDIDPDMPGRDGGGLKIEDVIINGNVWKKLVIKAGTGASISYELQTKENFYLVGYEISADYFPFLNESEKYVEKILSTFKFVGESDSTPKPINYSIPNDWKTSTILDIV